MLQISRKHLNIKQLFMFTRLKIGIVNDGKIIREI